MSPQKSVLVTDFDNTLYDWVEMWYRAFSAMFEVLLEDTGHDPDDLKAAFRRVYRLHGTSEYAYVIEELTELAPEMLPEERVERFKSAIVAYRNARQGALHLYPTVRETLHTLKSSGCLIVVFTESLGYHSRKRLKSLGLDGVVDFLYTPPHFSRTFEPEYPPDSEIELIHTIHKYTEPDEYKPDVHVLNRILEEVGASKSETIYVGDSPMKDIAMAQDAGVTDVHATYGLAQQRPEYDLLRAVSHWIDEDIERERQIHSRDDVTPSFVLKESFGELLYLFVFVPFGS